MDLRLYTDENYVPMSDLLSFGPEFVNKISEYRRTFMEVVNLNDFDFVNIIETPSLIKKRFIKNIELKGLFDFEAENNDYILEIAKLIVANKEVKGLKIPNNDILIKKYVDNNKDLTIITNYIVKNIDSLLVIEKDGVGNLEQRIPELTKLDVAFIVSCNNSNLNYTISDYQEVNKCSYETGRKACDKFVELDLFIKKKVGKKFVYKPTDKLQLLVKGGKYEH